MVWHVELLYLLYLLSHQTFFFRSAPNNTWDGDKPLSVSGTLSPPLDSPRKQARSSAFDFFPFGIVFAQRNNNFIEFARIFLSLERRLTAGGLSIFSA